MRGNRMKLVYGVRPIPVGVLIVLEVLKAVVQRI